MVGTLAGLIGVTFLCRPLSVSRRPLGARRVAPALADGLLSGLLRLHRP